ncbi:hypothetical protein ACO0K9_13355 [Undibacterium sp. Ji50W]|uniref:hypothetical protein n=1 Tax=Undibacterium sp. Ji50W TaxID=3413041 RepID=UPI003BF08C12
MNKKAEFGKFAVMIKSKDGGGVINGGRFKPSSVVQQVQQALGDFKVSRLTGSVDKFNQKTHDMCWRRYKARPANGSAKNPAETIANFCSYDESHEDYLFFAATSTIFLPKSV